MRLLIAVSAMLCAGLAALWGLRWHDDLLVSDAGRTVIYVCAGNGLVTVGHEWGIVPSGHITVDHHATGTILLKWSGLGFGYRDVFPETEMTEVTIPMYAPMIVFAVLPVLRLRRRKVQGFMIQSSGEGTTRTAQSTIPSA